MKKAANAMAARAIIPTAIPMPAFAPDDSPDEAELESDPAGEVFAGDEEPVVAPGKLAVFDIVPPEAVADDPVAVVVIPNSERSSCLYSTVIG